MNLPSFSLDKNDHLKAFSDLLHLFTKQFILRFCVVHSWQDYLHKTWWEQCAYLHKYAVLSAKVTQVLISSIANFDDPDLLNFNVSGTIFAWGC